MTARKAGTEIYHWETLKHPYKWSTVWKTLWVSQYVKGFTKIALDICHPSHNKTGKTQWILVVADKELIRLQLEFKICWRQFMNKETKKLFGKSNVKKVKTVVKILVC